MLTEKNKRLHRYLLVRFEYIPSASCCTVCKCRTAFLRTLCCKKNVCDKCFMHFEKCCDYKVKEGRVIEEVLPPRRGMLRKRCLN